MSLSYPVRSNIGAAAAATLASPGIPNTATTGSTFTVTGLSGFFDVATGSVPSASNQVVMAIEYGTTNVEKILCTYSGGTFTIVSRNYDSTSTSVPTHVAGVSVIPVFSANEAAEHNAAVQSLKHVLTSGSGGTSTDPGLITVSSGAGSRGSAPYAANSDHSHTLSSSQLATWISTPATVPGSSVTGALAAAVTLDASQLTAASTGTALPANTTIGVSQLTGTALPSGVTIGVSQLTGTALPSGVTIGASQLTGTALPTAIALPVGQVVNPVFTTSAGSVSATSAYAIYNFTGTGTTFTLPSTGIPVGTILHVMQTNAGGTTTFAQGSGTTIISAGATGTAPKTIKGGIAIAIQITLGTWVVGGQIA